MFADPYRVGNLTEQLRGDSRERGHLVDEAFDGGFVDPGGSARHTELVPELGQFAVHLAFRVAHLRRHLRDRRPQCTTLGASAASSPKAPFVPGEAADAMLSNGLGAPAARSPEPATSDRPSRGPTDANQPSMEPAASRM